MNPCPECESTDRYENEDRYALLRVNGDALKIGNKIEAYRAKLIVCRACGYVALFTNPT